MLQRYRLYIPGIILFIISVLVVVMTYEKYGMSCDERVQHEAGVVSYNYIYYADTTLYNYLERDHGVAYELPLIWLEKNVGLQSSQDIYHMRHLVGGIFFILGALCMYILSAKLFRSRVLAVLCFLMLLLHPRIYAHSFFNSKDIPFLVAVIFTLFFLQSAISKKQTIWFAFFGLAAAYATGIRVMGILLLAVFFVVWFLMFLDKQLDEKQKIKLFFNGLICTVCYCVATYSFWPLLWENPVANFANAFSSFSRFRVDGYVLFMGERLVSTQLPWYYIPVWIAISTPIVWLVMIAAGMVIFPVILFRQWKQIASDSNKLFILYCYLVAVLSVASVVLFRSIVYDDWRHLYYIYPCIVLPAIYIIYMVNRQTIKNILFTAGILQCVPIVIFMWANHPFQQVYFNEATPKTKDYLVRHYDMEYWGTSYGAALKYILNRDKRSSVKIAYNQWYLGHNNLLLLRDDERVRIQLVNSIAEADYYLTNFRYDSREIYDTTGTVFEIRVLNSPIMRVRKMN